MCVYIYIYIYIYIYMDLCGCISVCVILDRSSNQGVCLQHLNAKLSERFLCLVYTFGTKIDKELCLHEIAWRPETGNFGVKQTKRVTQLEQSVREVTKVKKDLEQSADWLRRQHEVSQQSERGLRAVKIRSSQS